MALGYSHARLLAASVLLAGAILPRTAGAAETGPAGAAKPAGIVDISLPAILAPMNVARRLESYAYIVIALTPTGPDKVLLIREKVPFLQDAFLRELNKESIVKPGDPKTVDADAVKARLTARMNQILPAGTVAALKFEQITITPIQSQS